MRLAVLGGHVVVARFGAGNPGLGLTQIRIDALVLHGLIIIVVYDEVGLAGTQQRLAAHGQRELGNLALADEALAHRIGVQAAEQPVAQMLVGVVPIFGEGVRRGFGHGAALVAQHGEVAVPSTAGIEHHVDARAIGDSAAQGEYRGVQLLDLHLLVAAEAARAHHHGRGQHVHAGVGLHARHLAVLHDDLLATGVVEEFAAVGLDVGHNGSGTTFAILHEVMAAAEAHAVGIGDKLHPDARVEHGIDGLPRMGQAVAQKRAVHAAAREVVHVGEDLIEGHRGILLGLQLGFAGRGAAAHGEVRDGRRGTRFNDYNLFTATGQVHGRHEAGCARADNGHVALLGLGALLALDALGRALARLTQSLACRGVRRLGRAAHQTSSSSQGAEGRQAEKCTTIHCSFHS